MPFGDGTGPQGKGPQTGRGMGKCRDRSRDSQQKRKVPFFSGFDFEALKKSAKTLPDASTEDDSNG